MTPAAKPVRSRVVPPGGSRCHRWASPVPWHAVQTIGMQVCVLAAQLHTLAGTKPLPLHSGHWSLRFMIAPIRVADHLVGFTR